MLTVSYSYAQHQARLVSEEPIILSLSSAIKTALSNNKDIQRALLSIDDAQQEVKKALSDFFPDVTINANFTRNIELPIIVFDVNGQVQTFKAGTTNQWQSSLVAEQFLFKGALIGASSASRLYKIIQQEAHHATAQQIVTNTRIAYYDVLINIEKYTIQEESYQRIEETLKESEKLFSVGLVSDYDVLGLNVQLENAKPNLERAKYLLNQSYRNLKLILGIAIEQEIHVLGDFKTLNIQPNSDNEKENEDILHIHNITPMYVSHDNTSKKFIRQRGDMRVLNAQLDFQKSVIKGLQLEYLPEITAVYNLNIGASFEDNQAFDNNYSRAQSVVVRLNFPLFRGFERSSEIQKQKIERKNILLQMEQAENAAKHQIQSVLENLSVSNNIYNSSKIALQQAKQGYEIASSRYKTGSVSALQLSNAELQLKQARLNLSVALYNVLLSKAQYDQAMGQVPFVTSKDISNG